MLTTPKKLSPYEAMKQASELLKQKNNVGVVNVSGLAEDFARNTASSYSLPVTPESFIPAVKKFDYTIDKNRLRNETVSTGNDADRAVENGGGEIAPTPWYQNGETLQGYAGLASSFMQAVALPGQMKLAKLQRQGLEQNLAQARADSAINATARSNLNAPSWNAPPVTGMA